MQTTRPRRWGELSPVTRGLVLGFGALDASLRVWALVDLKGRPAQSLHGKKAVWALALASVSSAGVLPAAYLLVGRRHGDG